MGVITLQVGATPKRLLANNPNRINFMLINNGSYDAYIGFDSNVSTTGKSKGVLLAANGGVWSYEFHKGEVWAVATGDTEITIVESTEGE